MIAGERENVSIGGLQAHLRGADRARVEHGAVSAGLHEHLLSRGRIVEQYLLPRRKFGAALWRVDAAVVADTQA
ncbi:hypothetical protein [Paraburkholderia sediminicola]|uniref:hypothetical protein n=1 Tax=Paraburkholderia sediminicola TaxID=458836 RepID=UPI0038BAC4B3